MVVSSCEAVAVRAVAVSRCLKFETDGRASAADTRYRHKYDSLSVRGSSGNWGAAEKVSTHLSILLDGHRFQKMGSKEPGFGVSGGVKELKLSLVWVLP